MYIPVLCEKITSNQLTVTRVYCCQIKKSIMDSQSGSYQLSGD